MIFANLIIRNLKLFYYDNTFLLKHKMITWAFSLVGPDDLSWRGSPAWPWLWSGWPHAHSSKATQPGFGPVWTGLVRSFRSEERRLRPGHAPGGALPGWHSVGQCSWDLGECSQHLHNLWARQEEVKNSHVRRFINQSQFKSQGFTQLLSAPQTRVLGRNQESVQLWRSDFQTNYQATNRMSLCSNITHGWR